MQPTLPAALVAVLLPNGPPIAEVDKRAGRALLGDHEPVNSKSDTLTTIVPVASSLLLYMPNVHPGEVVATVPEVGAGANDNNPASLK